MVLEKGTIIIVHLKQEDILVFFLLQNKTLHDSKKYDNIHDLNNS